MISTDTSDDPLLSYVALEEYCEIVGFLYTHAMNVIGKEIFKIIGATYK